LQQEDGSLYPLFTRLNANPRWNPVYVDMRTVIFVREGGKNTKFLSENRISSENFFERVIGGFRSRVATDGGDFLAWQGGVEFYIAARRFPEARAILMQALQLAPNHPGLLRLVPQVGGF
jgi:hypothetical protein